MVNERCSGGLPEWLKGADCKSADIVYIGSNPIPPIACREAAGDIGRAGIEESRV